MNPQDRDHLQLLTIFHYVVAGLAALFACIPFLHFFMGLAFATGLFGEGEREATVIGIGLMAVTGVIILAGWTFAGLVLWAGRNLAKRTRYTFCLVMAGVQCIFMPFGTVLGVFTIIVLMRDSVKAEFA
jgi:hypothetical protein